MKKWVYLFLVAAWATACSSNDDSNAKLEVRLTDAPGDYEEVNIDIQGVEVHTAAGGQDSGWKTLDIKAGVHNILKLANGQDTLLGTLELPAGRVSQVRLILGNNNSVKIDGQTKSLATPSAQQSGLKLNVQADLTEGVTYSLVLDFDAARSIVSQGNGEYSLKPVIRALSEATSGAIKGVISPVAATPAVFAVSVSGDTVATAYIDATGKFLLRAIDPGTYTVKFSPKTGYEATEKTGVIVTLGAVTDLGTVNIP